MPKPDIAAILGAEKSEPAGPGDVAKFVGRHAQPDDTADDALRAACDLAAKKITRVETHPDNRLISAIIQDDVAPLLAAERERTAAERAIAKVWEDAARKLEPERNVAVLRANGLEARKDIALHQRDAAESDLADARRQLAECQQQLEGLRVIRDYAYQVQRAETAERKLTEARVEATDSQLEHAHRLSRRAEAAEAACAAAKQCIDKYALATPRTPVEDEGCRVAEQIGSALSTAGQSLLDELARKTKALEFFADRRHWSSSDPKWLVGPSPGYTIAQEALRPEGGKGDDKRSD